MQSLIAYFRLLLRQMLMPRMTTAHARILQFNAVPMYKRPPKVLLPLSLSHRGADVSSLLLLPGLLQSQKQLVTDEEVGNTSWCQS